MWTTDGVLLSGKIAVCVAYLRNLNDLKVRNPGEMTFFFFFFLSVEVLLAAQGRIRTNLTQQSFMFLCLCVGLLVC